MAPAVRPPRFRCPVMKPMRHLVSPSGLMLPALRRSLWVHGDTAIEFLVARKLIQSIMDDRPHVSLVVTAPQADTVRFLGRTFPDEQALPMPQPAAMGRWLRTLQVRHLLLLDAGRSLPATVIQATVARGIPISAVNIADPLAVPTALLSAARDMPSSVRLCVHDAVVTSELLGRGIPSNVVVETGSLCCDRGRHTPGALLRQRLQLSDQVPIAAALDVPAAEEALVLDTFAEARSLRPDLRLLCETRDVRRAGDLQRQFESRGWTVATPSALAARDAEHWDVLMPSEPGEAASLLPIASVASVGGSYGVNPSGAVAALAATAGLRTLVGPRRDFTDVPWRILEHLPGMQPIDPCSLAREFATASTGAAALPHVPAAGSESVRRTHDALAAWLPESPPLPPVAQNWKIPTWRDRVGRSPFWAVLSRPLARGRIDTWAALAERLHNPRTVLCLGNGPSSEDPQLESLDHDCLFRINWRWKERGLLVHPQVVFVGDPATLSKVDGAVFGIWNRSLEQGMLLRHLITRGVGIMRYVTMERISPLVRDRVWPARPTNGALMIAAAAALNPARLIIAGIDLYQHPEGRYPGDLLATNAYSRCHARTTDLDIIRLALAGYGGEVTILGDALKAAAADAGEARHD